MALPEGFWDWAVRAPARANTASAAEKCAEALVILRSRPQDNCYEDDAPDWLHESRCHPGCARLDLEPTREKQRETEREKEAEREQSRAERAERERERERERESREKRKRQTERDRQRQREKG
jgi:hypothetical protein